MESLVFVLFVIVVLCVWMRQVSQPRVCVRRVRHHSVLASDGRQFSNTSWRARDAVQSNLYAKRLRSLRARADRYDDSGRGRPLLHLN